MRYAVAAATLVASLWMQPVVAGEPSISGLAANALVDSYAALGFDTAGEPPFRLQPYVVEIAYGAGYFRVAFTADTKDETLIAIMNAKTGKVVWTNLDGPFRQRNLQFSFDEWYVLPGIVAGEIISAHRHALTENLTFIQRGAYDLRYEPLGGGLVVGFRPLHAPPSTISVAPTLRPSVRSKCLSACGGETAYAVHVLNGRVEVNRDMIP